MAWFGTSGGNQLFPYAGYAGRATAQGQTANPWDALLPQTGMAGTLSNRPGTSGWSAQLQPGFQQPRPAASPTAQGSAFAARPQPIAASAFGGSPWAAWFNPGARMGFAAAPAGAPRYTSGALLQAMLRGTLFPGQAAGMALAAPMG